MIKTVALVFFILSTVALGGLLVRQTHQNAERSAEVATLHEKVSEQDQVITRTKAAVADLEQKRAQLAARNKAAKQAVADAQSQAAAAVAESTPTADASPAPPTGSDGKKKKGANAFADSITKMMKDPAMKKMMRTSQGAALKQMYGDLVKQWSLSPQETQTFYDMLLDKQMDQMDQGMSILEKGPDAAKTIAAADPDAKLKASLGDNLYKQYQDYEKTLSGRFAVNQFQQQLISSNTAALTPDQSATLLQTITEENASLPAGMSARELNANGKAFSMDSAQVDQFMKSQGDLNDRVDARMANTLSADQLRVLKEQQQQTLAMQRMGMEMASKMMAAPSPTP